MRLGRRHQFVGIVGDDAPPGLALLEVPGSDRLCSAEIGGRSCERVEAQVGATPVLVGSVAVEAGLGKDGPDIAIELNRTIRRGRFRHGSLGESRMFHRTGRLNNFPGIAFRGGCVGEEGGGCVSFHHFLHGGFGRFGGFGENHRIRGKGHFPKQPRRHEESDAGRRREPRETTRFAGVGNFFRAHLFHRDRDGRFCDGVSRHRQPGFDFAMIEVGIECLGRAPQEILKGLALSLVKRTLTQQREPVIELFFVGHGIRFSKGFPRRVRGGIRGARSRSDFAAPDGGAGRWHWACGCSPSRGFRASSHRGKSGR